VPFVGFPQGRCKTGEVGGANAGCSIIRLRESKGENERRAYVKVLYEKRERAQREKEVVIRKKIAHILPEKKACHREGAEKKVNPPMMLREGEKKKRRKRTADRIKKELIPRGKRRRGQGGSLGLGLQKKRGECSGPDGSLREWVEGI